MSDKQIEWEFYVPLAILGFIFAVLATSTFDADYLLQPLNLPAWNRLSILFFSLLGGIFFFGMVQLGFYLWKISVYISEKAWFFVRSLTNQEDVKG